MRPRIPRRVPVRWLAAVPDRRYPPDVRIWTIPLLVLLLVALRIAQYLSIAPTTWDSEWAGMARLAWESQVLGAVWPSTPREWGDYAYMSFAQGTLFPVLWTAWLSRLAPLHTWMLQSSSLLAEALTVGLAAVLFLGRRTDWRAAAALAPWFCVPLAVLGWLLMPFGNHTEYIWITVCLALLLQRSPAHWTPGRWLLTGAVVATGVFCYRGHVSSAGALAAVFVTSRGLRAKLLGPAVALGGAGLGLWVASWFIDPIHGLPEALFPSTRLRFDVVSSFGPQDFLRLVPRPLALPLPVWASGLGLLALLALAAVRDRAARFVGALLVMQLAAIGLLEMNFSQYWMPPYYSVLLGAGLAATSPWRVARPAALALAAWAVLCVPDTFGHIAPHRWSAYAAYDPLPAGYRLRPATLSPDLVEPLLRLVEQGAGPSLTEGLGRCPSAMRYGPPRDFDWLDDGPMCCESVAGLLQERAAELDLEQVAIGLWLACGRDEARFEGAVKGVGKAQEAALRQGLELWRSDPRGWSPARR